MSGRGRPKGVIARKPRVIRSLILDELVRGPCTRVQLRQRTGLSHNVVLNYIERLVAEGIIECIGKAPSGRGGASPKVYRLRQWVFALPAVQDGVRTTIRGPWPVSVPGRRAT